MKRNIYLDFGYFILLGATFGAVLVLGAIVAPVVFHTDAITVDLLIDHYNSGIIMAEIFHRFAYWIYFLTIYVVFYEARLYKQGQRDAIAFGSASIVVATSLLFSAVYVPKILGMQALGREATQSDTFANLHMASEIDFKILLVALVVLFVRRILLLRIS